MVQLLQFKKESLQKLLNEYYKNIDWIVIGGHSRRRVTFQIDVKNRLGFFAEKSHSLVEIDKDPLAEKEISTLISPLKNFLENQEENFFVQAVVTLFDNGLDLIFVTKREPNLSQIQKLISFAKEQNLNVSYRIKEAVTPIFLNRKNQIFFQDFKVDLDSDIFLQATKSGLDNIIKIIRGWCLAPKAPGTFLQVADIYAGFGVYSFAIHDLVKSVSAFEGSKNMIDLLNANAAKNRLKNKIKGFIRDIFSSPLTKRELKEFNLVIINPPRNGASPQMLEISKSTIRNLIYVSCNPESFKRDAKILIDSGFKITNLTAIDQFYATKHLELVANFQK